MIHGARPKVCRRFVGGVGVSGIDLGSWFESHASSVRTNLDRYFGATEGYRFTGRHFEHYAAMGHPSRFEPSDLLAIESLSVSLPTEVSAQLFIEQSDFFSELLEEIPANVDIWNVPRWVLDDDHPAAELHRRLKSLDDVGAVKAGKLLAAKRPRLIPIYDDFVSSELKPAHGKFWVSMHDQLTDPALRAGIASVCSNAPDHVSLLRRIDVAIWMHVWVRRSGSTT